MKKLNHILMAAAVAAAIVQTSRANASDEPVLSPKARQMQESLRQVPGPSEDKLDRSVKAMPPRTLQLAESLRVVPASSNGVDLAHPRGIVWMGKQSLITPQMQIAPLK